MASPTTIEPIAPPGPAAADTSTADLLTFTAGAAREQLGAARCSIHLCGPDGTLRRVATAAAPDLPVRGRPASGPSPLAREAVRALRPARAVVTPGELTLVHPRPVRPVLAVPLLVDGVALGVLEVERRHGEGGDDRAALHFAALAAAALGRTAHSTDLARRERGLAAAEQSRRLQAGLTRAVLGGAEAEDVVALLGDLLGRPVALLDPALRVRTWAAPPVLRLTAAPSLPVAALEAATVRDTLAGLGPDRPSTVLKPHLPSGLTRRHLVAVLVVEGRTAGYLDVIEMGRALGPAETLLAEHAATVLSLQVLGETRRDRASVQTRDDVLTDLLRGSRAVDDLRRLALHAGLDLRRPHLVVRAPVEPARSPARCRAAVAAGVAAALGEQAFALAVPDAVVLLAALPADPGPAQLRRVHDALRGILDTVAARTGIRRVVVSGVCRDVPDYPVAHAETREVDGIVAALGGRAEVVAVTELSTLRLVVNGDRADVALRFAQECLGPLRRSDDSGGGDLVETLRRYLESGAQVRATAKALGVHENTVRYRLGRIEHITGLDMRRFDALLTAQLAFQVEALAT